jgi:hypothetical protein
MFDTDSRAWPSEEKADDMTLRRTLALRSRFLPPKKTSHFNTSARYTFGAPLIDLPDLRLPVYWEDLRAF